MKLRLRSKFSIVIGGTALASALIAGAVFLLFARQATDELYESSAGTISELLIGQLEAHGEGIVSTLAKALADPLYFDNYDAIRTLTRTPLSLKDVRAVHLYDREGQVIDDGTLTIASFGAPAPADVAETVLQNGNMLIRHGDQLGSAVHIHDGEDDHSHHDPLIAAPIRIGDEIIGAISIQFDETALLADLSSYKQDFAGHIAASSRDFINALLITIPILLLLSALVATHLARRNSRPIERLQNAAGRIAAGSFDVEWPPERNDELGDLANSLRTMVHELRTKTVSAEYLDDIIGSMFDCLIVTDSGGRIEKVNEATCRLTGFTRHELINRTFSDFVRICDVGSNGGGPGDGTSAPGAAGDEDAYLLTRSGGEIPVQMGSSIMASHVDRRPRSVRILRDISLRKEREAEIERAREEAEAANASKSRFLASMSHELRTPLNAILGFSSIMIDALKGPLSDDYRGYANDIKDSANHLLAIINDLLDISKLEAGRMELIEADADLGEIMALCLRLVGPRAKERSITFDVPDPSTAPRVRADQRMVKQMILNLLSNATKFNREGGVITVRYDRDSAGALRLTVTDEGIGMEEADIPRVLEPFSQADTRLSRKYEGTGLGLAITKSMITLHGGSIHIRSAPDKGTSVTLAFPPERTLVDA